MNITFNNKQFDFILNTLKSKYPESASGIFEELKKAKDLKELSDIAQEFVARQLQANLENKEV